MVDNNLAGRQKLLENRFTESKDSNLREEQKSYTTCQSCKDLRSDLHQERLNNMKLREKYNGLKAKNSCKNMATKFSK